MPMIKSVMPKFGAVRITYLAGWRPLKTDGENLLNHQ